MEPLEGAIFPEQKRAQMPAIYIAQAPLKVVVFGKEQGGIGAVARILVEQAIYQLQKALWLIEGNGALAAQVGLQIGHQQSSCNALA